METLRHIVLQETNEEKYNRKHIDVKIREAIESNPEMMAKLQEGVDLVNGYLEGTYYASKMRRIAQLSTIDVPTLVLDIFVGVAYSLQLELFTSVTAQMSARLNFSDKTEAIATVGELLAVLCVTDAFDIKKESRQGSLMVVSRIPLSDELVEFIEHSQYLPPMVCEPLELSHNHSSGYLTHNDSLILGSGNHHDGDICLDVLNTINSVAFKLDTAFLSKMEEDASDITLDKIKEAASKKGKHLSDALAKERVRLALEGWDRFKRQSYKFYSLMVQCGNRIYFNNKVDKRGRIYSCGYHINPQGAPFKKAQLELAYEELICGVPTN